MGVFENFPYTNFHDLNLNWILQIVKALDAEVDAGKLRMDQFDAILAGLPAETRALILQVLAEEHIEPLPIVSVVDDGYILGVLDGVWTKVLLPANLPATTSRDNGKIMAVVDGAWNKSFISSIQPKNFPELPYPIVSDAFGHYKIGVDIASLEMEGKTYEEIWVDSVEGVDRSGASSQNAPFKTLKQAYTRAQNRNAIIHVSSTSIFWDDDLPGTSYNVKGYTWITEGNGCLAIWGIKNPAWTAWPSVPGAYVAETAPKRCSGIWDATPSNTDKFGFYAGYQRVDDPLNMTPGTFHTTADGRTVYVFPKDGSSINAIFPLRGDLRTGSSASDRFGMRFNMTTAEDESTFILRDFEYIGNFYTSSRGPSMAQPLKRRAWIYENCKFSHQTDGDAISHANADLVYCVNCAAAYAQKDIFNATCSTDYMTEAQITGTVYAYVNCQAIEAGWYDSFGVNTDNLYTCHGGLNVVRANCRGYNARGPMLADVNGCRSANYYINIYNNSYPGIVVRGCTAFNNEQGFRSGNITLENVYAGDNILRGEDAEHNPIPTPKCDTECDVEMLGGNLFSDMKTYNGAIITPVEITR